MAPPAAPAMAPVGAVTLRRSCWRASSASRSLLARSRSAAASRSAASRASRMRRALASASRLSRSACSSARLFASARCSAAFRAASACSRASLEASAFFSAVFRASCSRRARSWVSQASASDARISVVSVSQVLWFMLPSSSALFTFSMSCVLVPVFKRAIASCVNLSFACLASSKRAWSYTPFRLTIASFRARTACLVRWSMIG
mmetsp:Transcript_17572/g.44846  ORF Transcript_17572/g.44846 Transcript_17572/m.44846 type:complete len:205 (+) Transcript_17572:279-893(+)